MASSHRNKPGRNKPRPSVKRRPFLTADPVPQDHDQITWYSAYNRADSGLRSRGFDNLHRELARKIGYTRFVALNDGQSNISIHCHRKTCTDTCPEFSQLAMDAMDTSGGVVVLTPYADKAAFEADFASQKDIASRKACITRWYCAPEEGDDEWAEATKAKAIKMFDDHVNNDFHDVLTFINTQVEARIKELQEKRSEITLQASAFNKKKARKAEKKKVERDAYIQRMFALSSYQCHGTDCHNLVVAMDPHGKEDTILGCAICKAIPSTFSDIEEDQKWIATYCTRPCMDKHLMEHQLKEHPCGAGSKCPSAGTRVKPITKGSSTLGQWCALCFEYFIVTWFCDEKCKSLSDHHVRDVGAHANLEPPARHWRIFKKKNKLDISEEKLVLLENSLDWLEDE